jgi:hypothetical protein
MATVDLSDSELELLVTALGELKRKKREALKVVSAHTQQFTEKDFGVPEIDALYGRVRQVYANSDAPDDPMMPRWTSHGVCPLLVIRGNISGGFSFYGPFDNESQVRAFADRLGFNVDSYEVKILDIPTH